MIKNIGTVDKVLRILLAVIVAVLIITKVLTGAAAIILAIVAGMFLITSLLGFCGLYSLIGINTCKTRKS
jgi:hypothetical protein